MPAGSPAATPAASSRLSAPHVAIVGATGAVGEEFLRVLHQRNFPIGKLTLLASARSAGKELRYGDQTIACRELTEDSFRGVDLALFSAGGSISKTLGPAAVDAGAVVVDNSSAFRMTDGVPLVVPEINPQAIADANLGLGSDQTPGIIANPNCSTIIMLMAVTPLHRAVRVKRMVVSTYQAASGAGAAAMRELEQQTREALDPATGGEVTTKDIFPFQYAFNLFSHNSPM
ncbi:MAG: aspartate-semialdehyde dehydrogenase, partial [Planctomycetota bacterium]